MRVVAGSGSTRDFRQAELDRHIEMVSRFVERSKSASAGPLALTLIVRSASSCPAKALVAVKDELVGAGRERQGDHRQARARRGSARAVHRLSELAPREQADQLIRWASNPRLLDAHEQVTYGDAMCWSGDPMRRDADKRNALALFDEAASDRVRHGTARLRGAVGRVLADTGTPPARPGTPKPSGAYQSSPETPVTALRPALQGWPLVRH